MTRRASPISGAALEEGQVLGSGVVCGPLLSTDGEGPIYGAAARDGRQCTLLLLTPRKPIAPEVLRSIENEVREVGALAHPNLLPVMEIVKCEGGELCLLRERLPGETLAARLARLGRPPVEAALDIIERMASALAIAHRHSIFHHHLCPDKVLLQSTAEGDIPRLLDVGISQLWDREPLRAAFLRPGYTAPEQVIGQAGTPQTDVYALGILCYELLSGAPPFSSRDPDVVLARHLNDMPVKLAERAQDRLFSAEIESFVGAMLAKDPQSRPKDGRAVLMRLRALRSAGDAVITLDEREAQLASGWRIASLRAQASALGLNEPPMESSESDEDDADLLRPIQRRARPNRSPGGPASRPNPTLAGLPPKGSIVERNSTAHRAVRPSPGSGGSIDIPIEFPHDVQGTAPHAAAGQAAPDGHAPAARSPLRDVALAQPAELALSGMLRPADGALDQNAADALALLLLPSNTGESEVVGQKGRRLLPWLLGELQQTVPFAGRNVPRYVFFAVGTCAMLVAACVLMIVMEGRSGGPVEAAQQPPQGIAKTAPRPAQAGEDAPRPAGEPASQAGGAAARIAVGSLFSTPALVLPKDRAGTEPGRSKAAEQGEDAEERPRSRQRREPAEKKEIEAQPAQAAPQLVTIRISSTPKGAQVSRDGQLLGTTPFSEALGQSAQTIHYQVSRAGYESAHLEVVPSQDLKLNVELDPILLFK